MPALYMLDTDTASYALKYSSARLLLRLKHIPPSSLCISVVSAGELLFGVKHFSAFHPSARNVQDLLQSANIPLWDLTAAKAYADIRSTLTRSGKLIGELDMMIAAHARSLDAVLVTNNTRHFERISPPLRLENWV